MPALLFESSAGTRSALRLVPGKRWLIGTDPRCSLQLPPGTAEPFHCEVFCSAGRWQVRDLLSSAGTLVCGKEAHQQPLAGGDVIQVGQAQVAFVLDGERLEAGSRPAPRAFGTRPREKLRRALARARASASAARRGSSGARAFMISLALVGGLAAAAAILSGILGSSAT